MTRHQRQTVQAPPDTTAIMLNLNQRFKQSAQRVASRPYPEPLNGHPTMVICSDGKPRATRMA
jgi:hypothetical protein